MKTIKLSPVDFYHFRTLALSMGILFACAMINGQYEIKANKKDLQELGY